MQLFEIILPLAADFSLLDRLFVEGDAPVVVSEAVAAAQPGYPGDPWDPHRDHVPGGLLRCRWRGRVRSIGGRAK